MANSFGIPPDIEHRLRVRDRKCVYCQRVMVKGRGYAFTATIEHLESSNGRGTAPTYWGYGLERVGLEGLAMCCGRCNSSRGMKLLNAWFASSYCQERDINARTVAPVVKRFLRRHPRG